MPSIQEMRRELKPVYRHYTDAVISMIGLQPYEAVLAAAKRGDLLEAHSAQVAVFDNNYRRFAREQHEHDLNFFTKLIRWKSAHGLAPTWFKKPLPTAKGKVSVFLKFEKSGQVDAVHPTLGKIGWLQIVEAQVGKVKTLVVGHLQQTTTYLNTKEARQVEGWKNIAMQELEKYARERRCQLVLFSTGERHSEENDLSRRTPIHNEILETYGRLPMQHGYKLAKVKLQSKHLIGTLHRLWWVKRV